MKKRKRRTDPRREYSKRLATLPEDERRRRLVFEDLGRALAAWDLATVHVNRSYRTALAWAERYQDARALERELGTLVDVMIVYCKRETQTAREREALGRFVMHVRRNEAQSKRFWPVPGRSLESILQQAKKEGMT